MAAMTAGGRQRAEGDAEAPLKVCKEKRRASETMWLKICPAGVSCDHTEQNTENTIQSAKRAPLPGKRQVPGRPLGYNRGDKKLLLHSHSAPHSSGSSRAEWISAPKTFGSGEDEGQGETLCGWVSFSGFKQETTKMLIVWGILK